MRRGDGVRFSLQEVKKTVQRRGSGLSIVLHFLRPGELREEIERLIAYHEGLLGQPQKRFSVDETRAVVGDYRLANCLSATLSAWYSWQGREWAEVVRQAGGDEAITGLEAAGIVSSVTLRLALYNYVNEHYHGFLPADQRPTALQAFAGGYSLQVADLEYLLALDSEDEALLVRTTAGPPTAQEVATLYNQWAFEAALFNASNVHFTIDCGTFQAHIAPETGLGSIIKRLCFLARKLGVYYDLAYEPTLPGVAPLLHLTLYGPQDVTGLPQQYGLRLARLCRLLLGYGTLGRTAQGEGKPAGRKSAGLVSALLEAEAVVHVLQRSYRFVLDANLLNLLPAQPVEAQVIALAGTSDGQGQGMAENQGQVEREVVGVFDSGVEQLFAEAFASLERSRGVDGWRLEREPEPLLLESSASTAGAGLQSIFIPDFALTRGARRIYMEILGFWTPAYRERKVQKLLQLQGRGDVLLAIPVEARDAFASIATSFPIVWYEGQLSATDVLSVLHAHYDDFAERLALIDVGEVREHVLAAGLVPEQACYELLHCYRRSEVQRASEQVVGENIAFVPGIGLFVTDWMEHLKCSFVEWISDKGALPLADALRESKERWPQLRACEDARIEAILSLWPEVHVNRTSIFAATVELATAETPSPSSKDVGSQSLNDVGAQFIAPESAPRPPKRQVRERRPSYKKRSTEETIQGDLWE
jgi:predicted nuclease of restriction endonuclease-like RecB superfamily